jgi:hypothetical protein
MALCLGAALLLLLALLTGAVARVRVLERFMRLVRIGFGVGLPPPCPPNILAAPAVVNAEPLATMSSTATIITLPITAPLNPESFAFILTSLAHSP